MWDTKAGMISFVMAVYNTPNDLLDRSIKSVLRQDYDDIELVIVDDGSKEVTAHYLDSFASNMVKVIHKENAGLSLARETGIKNSSGEYVGFIDSDDFIEPCFASTMVKAIRRTGSDAADCSFFVNKGEGRGKRYMLRKSGRLLDKHQAIRMLLSDFSMRGFVWCKVFKKEALMGDSGFDFGGIKYFEDMPLCFSAFSKCKRIVYLNKPLYHYYKANDGSITNTLDPNRARRHLNSYLFIADMACRSEDKKLIKIVKKSYIRCKMSLDYDVCLSKKAGLSKGEAKKIYEDLKKIKSI